MDACSVTRYWNKSSPNFHKVEPKKKAQQCSQKCIVLKVAQNVTKNVGYFCKKNCHPEVTKIGQIWSHWMRGMNLL